MRPFYGTFIRNDTMKMYPNFIKENNFNNILTLKAVYWAAEDHVIK